MVRLSSAVIQKSQKYSATGNLFSADFTGRYGTYTFQDFQTTLNYDVAFESPRSRCARRRWNSAKATPPAGTWRYRATWTWTSNPPAEFKLVDLNANAVAPFLAPSLGDKKLVSISLSGAGSTAYNPKGETTIKADLNVTNWVVSAPQQQFTSPVLGAKLQLDGAAKGQVMELRQLLLKLSPTVRAKNELKVQAHLDMGKTNASPSQMTVQSDSLDVSPYLRDVRRKYCDESWRRPTCRAPPPSRQPPIEAAASSGAGASGVAFQQFNGDVKIGRLHPREIAITNLQANAKIKGDELTVRPIDLTLNGGPVNASAMFNLGVERLYLRSLL